MSKAVEIIKTITSPAIKLINAVSGAIGKAYEPTHIKRMAKARAYEIEKVGRALRENADIPIQYSKGEISADTNDFDEFVKRTQSRIAYQELQKQQNIESVADKAYDLLSEETKCSDEPVDNDWMIRFFNSVQDISDEDMQTLWAKILAGEIVHPKKCSLRTLETLKNLSKDEAQLFQRVSSYIISGDNGSFFPSDTEMYDLINISFPNILLLIECGLIASKSFVSFNIDLSENDESVLYSKQFFMKLKANEEVHISFGVYSLTNSGIELFNILETPKIDEKTFVNYTKQLFGDDIKGTELSIFKILSVTEADIEYEEDPFEIIKLE